MAFFDYFKAALPVVGSVFGNMYGQSENERMYRQSQDFQRSERLASQQWQEDQWNRQFFMNNGEYWKRVNDERQYNSPQAQLNRIRATGYSPDIFGSDGATTSSSFGVPSSPSPVPVQGNAGTPPPYIDRPSMAQSFSDAASALASISQAGLSDANKERIETILTSELEKMASETQLNNLKAKGEEITNEVAALTKDTKVAQAAWDLLYTKALAALTGQQTQTETQKELYYEEQRFWSMADRKLKHQQVEHLKKIVDHFEETWVNEQNKVKSETTRNYAHSSMLTQLADSISYENLVNSDDEVIKKKKEQVLETLKKTQSETNLNEEQKKQVGELIRRLENENDTYYIRLIFNSLLDIVKTGASVAKVVKK